MYIFVDFCFYCIYVLCCIYCLVVSIVSLSLDPSAQVLVLLQPNNQSLPHFPLRLCLHRRIPSLLGKVRGKVEYDMIETFTLKDHQTVCNYLAFEEMLLLEDKIWGLPEPDKNLPMPKRVVDYQRLVSRRVRRGRVFFTVYEWVDIDSSEEVPELSFKVRLKPEIVELFKNPFSERRYPKLRRRVHFKPVDYSI